MSEKQKQVNMENAIHLTSEFYLARTQMRDYFGDKYAARGAPYSECLARWQTESGLSLLQLAKHLCEPSA